jgi:hypothetical protein
MYKMPRYKNNNRRTRRTTKVPPKPYDEFPVGSLEYAKQKEAEQQKLRREEAIREYNRKEAERLEADRFTEIKR